MMKKIQKISMMISSVMKAKVMRFLLFKVNLPNNQLLLQNRKLLLIQMMRVMMKISMINLLMTLVMIVKNKIYPNFCKKLNNLSKIKRMYLQLFSKSQQLKLILTQSQQVSHLKSLPINHLRSHNKTKTKVNHSKLKIKTRMVVQSLSSSNNIKVTTTRRTKRRETRRTSTIRNEVFCMTQI